MIGFVNGALVVLRFNSCVVTLATSTIIAGIAMWFTGGQVLFTCQLGRYWQAIEKLRNLAPPLPLQMRPTLARPPKR